MLFLKVIDFKKYFLYSSLSTGAALLFVQRPQEVIAILVVYLTTILNHMLLVECVGELTKNAKVGGNRLKIVLLFIFKLLILFAALGLGIHLMAKRVLIPLFNYVIFIFILGYSLKGEKQ
jgi:hypothetical protein